MRKKLIIFTVIVISALLGSLLVKYISSDANRLVDPSRSERVDESAAVTPVDSEQLSLDAASAEPDEGAYSELLSEYEKFRPSRFTDSQWQKIVYQYLLGKRGNGEFSFYGRVIDGSGKPIPGVTIELQIDSNEDDFAKVLETQEYRAPEKILEVVSDSEGEFSVRNEKGTELIILEMKKDGYALVGRSWFSFETEPDSVIINELGTLSEPVLFEMAGE